MPEVLLTRRAEAEVKRIHRWWARHRSIEQADRWHVRCIESMLSLGSDPDRFALAAENAKFPYPVREMPFGLGVRPTHRIFYTIRPKIVLVLRVRHLAQRAISPDD